MLYISRIFKPAFKIQYSSLSSNLIKYNFSQYFEQKDQRDLQQYSNRKFYHKYYRSLIDKWKKPLQQKKKRQQRIKQIKAALPQPQPQQEKLVVHNNSIGIKYPPQKNQIFCLLKVNGFQYKITQDCLLLLDTKPQYQINSTIQFKDILLCGTPSYTVLGRPFVAGTWVEGSIQSISDSQKLIVFKKKRRKQYKRSFGSRASLTSIRITKIHHVLQNQVLNKAVNLQ